MYKIVTPILSILIGGTVLFFFVMPMIRDVQALQAESAQYSDAVTNAVNFNSLLESLLTQQNTFSASELERIEALVPNAVDEVRMLHDLQTLAEQYGLVFSGVTTSLKEPDFETLDAEAGGRPRGGLRDGDQPVSPVAGVLVSDVNFTVIGTYSSFRAFLENLERSLVLMEVMNITFSGTEGELNSYAMTVRLFSLDDSSI